MNKFEKINQYDNIKNFIIDKIKLKIDSELNDEKDLLFIYKKKITNFINKSKEDNLLKDEKINEKIKQIIDTPLEGEISKHNKIKIVNIKLIKKDTLDILM